MMIHEQIIGIASKKESFTTADVTRAVKGKWTRQYISAIIKRLVGQGKLVKSGSTAKARYALPKNAHAFGDSTKRHLLRAGTKEHEVLDDLNRKTPFLTALNENLRHLLDYAFSEMLNNALDHSKSKFVDVEIGMDPKALTFTVSDLGIGVFKNIMRSRKLKSEFEAMQDLLKGKATTQPHAHSGEGIFFTSKVADLFVLESFGYVLRIDNKIPDIFFEEVSPVKRGTRVHFIIARNTHKHLSDIFGKYETNPDEPDFDKTEIHVKLYKIGTVYVSRSQARRILTGLEKFKHIVLNFEDISTIGQGFADEIFRVFHLKYPDIVITPIHVNEAVKYMVDRVDKPKI